MSTPRMNEAAWEQLAQERSNRQPTPPIGKTVQWFQGNDTSQARAAIVTAIEGPGRVSLVVFSRGQMHLHKTGVFHASAPIHKKKGNPTSVQSGSWNYLPGEVPPKSDYDLHDSQIKSRTDKLNAAEEQWKLDQKKRQEQLKEIAGASA